MSQTVTLQVRRGTENGPTGWGIINPTLTEGEPGFATDTGVFKIGDGKTKWNDLPINSQSYGDALSGISIGFHAGSGANSTIAIGGGAGFNDQGAAAIALGFYAAENNQGLASIAIGTGAGYNNQGRQSIAIGVGAGYDDQPSNTIILNASTSNLNGASGQTGSFYVAPIRPDTASNSLMYNTTTNEITYSPALSFDTVNIAIGQNAADVGQGESAIAIGTYAGTNAQGDYSVAIGRIAGNDNQGTGSVAIGQNAGNLFQGNYSVAIGDNAGNNLQGTYAVAIGCGAGQNVQADNTIILNASGQLLNGVPGQTGSFFVDPIREADTSYSLKYNTTTKEITWYDSSLAGGEIQSSIASQPNGKSSVVCDNGGMVIAANNAIDIVTASTRAYFETPPPGLPAGTIGLFANTTAAQMVIGGDSAVQTGLWVGADEVRFNGRNISNNITEVAIGKNSGETNQLVGAIAIGSQAGQTGQKERAVAVGFCTGLVSQGTCSVAIGSGAGFQNQADNTIILNATGNELNGVPNQTGSFYVNPIRNAVAPFSLMYNTTTKEITYSQVSSSFNTDKIAIGNNAGYNAQGDYAVAIGRSTGVYSQGYSAVAIGLQAGENVQGDYAVAIGKNTGEYTQGNYAVAIGGFAGENNQGDYSIALGYYAGYINQAANTIILNATGNELNGVANQPGSFYVNPIRNAVAPFSLMYNTTTKEITYSQVSSSFNTDKIAIGNAAGMRNQGSYAIAIGAGAGMENQANNSIILNATGHQVNGVPNQSGSFYVDPIRQDLTKTIPLMYDPATKEIVQGSASALAGPTGPTGTNGTNGTNGVPLPWVQEPPALQGVINVSSTGPTTITVDLSALANSRYLLTLSPTGTFSAKRRSLTTIIEKNDFFVLGGTTLFFDVNDFITVSPSNSLISPQITFIFAPQPTTIFSEDYTFFLRTIS